MTIPIALILCFLHMPMSTSDDKIKIRYVVAFSVLYTSPLINYLIYYKSLNFNPINILWTIGYEPIEQYLLHSMHAIITAYLYIHISKFTLPILHIGKFGRSLFHRVLMLHLFPTLCCYFVYFGWLKAIPGTCTFYYVSKKQ